jgi:predicted transcriptional regulator
MDTTEQHMRPNGIEEETPAGHDRAPDSMSAWLADDPTHRVGQLNLARKKPVWTKPNATISQAITLMMLHNFSQLPVMKSSRNVVGLFSWKSLAQRLAFGKNPTHVCDAMESPVVIDANRSLFETARLVADSDCVLIKDEDDAQR